jgi:protein-disulfide isomerase
MQSKGYILTVLIITVVTLAIGAALWHSGTQRLIIDKECDGWCRGAEEPLVIIDAFPDFGCQLCVNKERMIIQALEVYPDDVRLDYHHYPYNDFSYTLAEALECAGEQDKFWELHDKIYLEDVPEDMSELLAAAENVGLDIDLFNESLDSGKFKDKILAERAQAIADGAQAMSVYINGNLYTGSASSLDDFCDVIDNELEKAGAAGGEQ